MRESLIIRKAECEAQLKEDKELNGRIKENLAKINILNEQH